MVCIHRTGLLEIGDTAVWVGVCSDHRGEAFDACSWVIDQVKHRVPIWKCEHYQDGERDWVSCHACMRTLDGTHQHVHGDPSQDRSPHATHSVLEQAV